MSDFDFWVLKTEDGEIRVFESFEDAKALHNGLYVHTLQDPDDEIQSYAIAGYYFGSSI